MRYRDWSTVAQWTAHLRLAQTPRELFEQEWATPTPYRVFDTATGERLQNSIAERCDYVTGLVLAAQDEGWIDRERALVVLGNGPTAFFSATLALLRGIPVVHLQLSHAAPLAPLTGSYRRWICPSFYQGVVEQPSSEWSWALPRPFVPIEAGRLAVMAGFGYKHEPAGAVAERWKRRFDALWEKIPGQKWRITLDRGEFAADPWRTVHATIERAAQDLGLEVGLLLSSRFADAEKLSFPDGESPPIYTSCAYWYQGKLEPWRSRGDVLVSGDGDGAMQDFLRAVWGWDEPRASATLYRDLFDPNDWPHVVRLSAKCGIYADAMIVRCGEIADKRLERLREEGLEADTVNDDAKRARHAVVQEVHTSVRSMTEDLLARIDPQRVPRPGRRVLLHTRADAFAPCYLHNLVFTLLTVRLLERSGSEPWIVQEAFDLSHSAPDVFDPENADHCAQYCSGALSAAGVTRLSHVLLRHGPERVNLRAQAH